MDEGKMGPFDKETVAYAELGDHGTFRKHL